LNNETLPWADWAAEFRENMPAELEKFVQDKAAGSASTDHTKSIRERLKDIMNLFRISRYRPSPNGSLLIDNEQLIRGGKTGSHRENKPFSTRKRSGKAGGTGGNVYSAFQKKDGVTGQQVNPDMFPSVRWVTVSDGTIVLGDIEDRAARYLADQNILLINSDFRVVTDMIEFFVNEFGSLSGVNSVVEDSVHGWFEQALVETVIGAQALQGSKEWTVQDVEAAFSEEALTAAVMQRYHVNIAVKRDLGSRLGSLRAMKVA
jgi:hypothetical protein